MAGNDLVARWVRPEIQALSAYPVPDATGLVKLDAMENPWAWPESVRQEWAECARTLDVNRYPDPAAGALRAQLRAFDGIGAAHGLLLGNGSDEIIQMLAMAVGGPERTILAPEPSFVMYRMIATFAGMQYHGVPLQAEDFSLDPAAMLAAIEQTRPAIVFLAVPNNPTGNVFARAQIEQIAEAAPGLVVIDEAYRAFTDSTQLDMLDRFDNVLVMRTLSKLGLAGLRIGYLVGAPAWIEQFEKVRLPYNIGVLAQAAASFALSRAGMLSEQTALIRAERARLCAELDKLPVQVWPSEANFILIRLQGAAARDVFTRMRERGVLVKCLDGAHPHLAGCLRLTVGTPDENVAMLQALSASLGE